MTKRARNKSSATRRPRKARRRISTRRLAASAGTRPRRTRRAESAALEAAGDTLEVVFDLRDVSGRPIRDPETFFTFRQLSTNRQLGDQVAVDLIGAPVPFDVPTATGEAIVCEFDPQRFRFAHSPVFFGTPGPAILRTAQLLREPKEWTPRFAPWNDLPGSFDELKRVLRASPQVTLFRQQQAIADLLVDSTYDVLSGAAETLAKTALLNTYFRLNHTAEPFSGERPWFAFVRRIIAIGRERFLAFVDPGMETLVRQIHTHIDEFRGDYERTPAENHRGNVPATLQTRISAMVSIKSSHAKGNFQLTLTRLTNPEEVLLDADIDESGDLLGHFFDVLKHKVSGGTHPHDIHEILVLQEGSKPGFDLGYTLV